jgi:hypothetical protein
MAYTVEDVRAAECNLEPLTCVHCCDSEGHVTYHQGVGDAYCAACGEWQSEDD